MKIEPKWSNSVQATGGGLDIFDTEDFSTLITLNASGNNVNFLGAGALDGAFSIDSVTPISGNESGRYTAGAASLNDYIEIKTIDLDPKQRGQDIKVRLVADMSNFSNDVTFVIYDKTNSKILSSELDLLTANANTDFYDFSAYIPSNCTQISYGFHMLAGAVDTEFFNFDDIEFTTSPFVYVQIENTTDWVSFTPVLTGFGTPTLNNGRWRRVGDSMEVEVSFTSGTPTATSLSVQLPNSLTIDSAKISSSLQNNLGTWAIVETATNYTSVGKDGYVFADTGTSSSIVYFSYRSTTSGTMDKHNGDAVFALGVGGIARFTVPVVGWSGSSEHVITPAKTNMTGWIDGGLLNITSTGTAPTKGTTTTDKIWYKRVGTDMHIRGEYRQITPGTTGTGGYLFGIPGGLTADTTKITAFPIADGLTGGKYITNTVGHGTAFPQSNARNAEFSLYVYDSTNLAGYGVFDNASGSFGQFNVMTLGEINGSIAFYAIVPIVEWSADVTFLAAIPLQKTAYIKDVKAAGTAPQALPTSVVTRDLNIIYGDSSFVSLSANQFLLSTGLYKISFNAPGRNCAETKAWIYNVTDAVDVVGLMGSVGNDAAPGDNVYSRGDGEIEITSPKLFELRQQAAAAGQGGLIWNIGKDEVYSVIVITKIR